MFILFGLVFPARPTSRIAVLALAFSFAIEFSQLYHAPWIDNLRAYRLGALVLGNSFAWADLVAYTMGIAVGTAAEWIAHRITDASRADRSTD